VKLKLFLVTTHSKTRVKRSTVLIRLLSISAVSKAHRKLQCLDTKINLHSDKSWCFRGSRRTIRGTKLLVKVSLQPSIRRLSAPMALSNATLLKISSGLAVVTCWTPFLTSTTLTETKLVPSLKDGTQAIPSLSPTVNKVFTLRLWTARVALSSVRRITCLFRPVLRERPLIQWRSLICIRSHFLMRGWLSRLKWKGWRRWFQGQRWMIRISNRFWVILTPKTRTLSWLPVRPLSPHAPTSTSSASKTTPSAPPPTSKNSRWKLPCAPLINCAPSLKQFVSKRRQILVSDSGHKFPGSLMQTYRRYAHNTLRNRVRWSLGHWKRRGRRRGEERDKYYMILLARLRSSDRRTSMMWRRLYISS